MATPSDRLLRRGSQLLRHDEGFDVPHPWDERLGPVRHLFSLVSKLFKLCDVLSFLFIATCVCFVCFVCRHFRFFFFRFVFFFVADVVVIFFVLSSLVLFDDGKLI